MKFIGVLHYGPHDGVEVALDSELATMHLEDARTEDFHRYDFLYLEPPNRYHYFNWSTKEDFESKTPSK